MHELRDKFERYQNLHLVAAVGIGKTGQDTLAQMNQKIKDQQELNESATPKRITEGDIEEKELAKIKEKNE